MAHQNVCQMFKYGYCKFKSVCRKQHILEKCTKSSCEINTCSQRHPAICRYLRDIHYCKFGEWCSFEHNFVDNVQGIKELTKKVKAIEKLVEEKSKIIESLEKKIIEKEENVLGILENKINIFEESLQSMNKSLVEKDLYISGLEATIRTNDIKFEEFEKENSLKIEALDKINKENVKNIKVLKMKLEEKFCEIQQSPKDLFKCTKCDFESQSKKGLNTHITRKHTDTSKLKFPKKCDLCDKDLDSETELRKHLKMHSYKEAKFQCEDCEFVGKTRETMDVHIGRYHTDKFECGICERQMINFEDLEIHLNTCEKYKCRWCWLETSTLPHMKDHTKEHENPEQILVEHYKMSRNSNSEVSMTVHSGKDL